MANQMPYSVPNLRDAIIVVTIPRQGLWQIIIRSKVMTLLITAIKYKKGLNTTDTSHITPNTFAMNCKKNTSKL